MNKTLIIAEKPSVALDISRALGGFAREGDYFESERYVLASSIGHLLSLVAPNDPVKGKWSFTHLPVIPPEFELGPTDKKSAERLKLLVRLAKRKDVDAIINACDAGREGELIFRYIIQYAGVKKPIQRLWLQSMTQAAIRDAFANLRDDVQLKPLEAAARSRAEADWLVGINGTRAMTAFNNKDGGFFKTPVGRVQTPTLAIVAERENASAPSCRATTGRCAPSSWPPPACTKPLDRPGLQGTSATRKARIAPVVASRRPERGGGLPRTARQRDRGIQALDPDVAGPVRPDLAAARGQRPLRLLGKTTLALAQTLYERHKALTYPRTDSRYLPEDYLNTVKETMRALAQGRLERRRRPGAPCRHRGRRGLGQAQPPHLRQQEGVGPLCHHPHAADPA